MSGDLHCVAQRCGHEEHWSRSTFRASINRARRACKDKGGRENN